MAEARETFEPPKTWEKLGAFFGYFAVAKDAPAIFRKLGISKLLPLRLKDLLLGWNSSTEFWFLVFFTILTLSLLVWLLPRKKKSKEEEAKDDAKKIVAYLHRDRIIRAIRSAGLTLIRGWTLDLLGVGLYGTFQRYSFWPPEPRRLKCVDRLTYVDGFGIEMQYSKNFETVFVRTHPKNDDTYGQVEERVPTWREIGLMLVASNCFPFWLIVFLIKRPLIWVMKLVGLR